MSNIKRNCNNCKALISNINGLGCRCSLGYKTKSTKEVYGLSVSYKPLEKCEKPLTYKDLVKIKR